MANFAASDLETRMLLALQATVSTDPPVSTVASAGTVAAAETYKFLNNSYLRLWKAWGGSVIAAASATLWNPAQSSGTTGKATGLLQTIEEITHLWATTTSGSTGGGSGDVELTRVDYATIEAHRSYGTGLGTYTTPVEYSVRMIASANAAASTNLWLLDYWPGVTALYFPAHYKPQFVALAAATDIPDLPDSAQLDIALLAAYDAAPLINRTDLRAGIADQIGDLGQKVLERKQSALVSADQDQ